MVCIVLITWQIHQNPCSIRKVEYTKGVIRSRNSKKDIQCNDLKKNGQTLIYNTLHRKLKNEQQKPHYKPEVNSDAVEWSAIPAPYMYTII
jgi:hypothetical protein